MILRGILFRLLLVSIMFGFASSGRSEEQVSKGRQDSWIDLVDLPKEDPARRSEVRGGIYPLLDDIQYRHSPGGNIRFARTAYLITERPGLERGARVDLEFDPARQHVILNRLNIIRGGVLIDRLPDARFNIYRRETDAERGIYDGRLTVHIDIDDVQIGDIIDYAVTYDTIELVGKDLFFADFTTERGEPIGMIRRRILWPKLQPLATLSFKTNIEPVIENSDGETSYLWQVENPSPVRADGNVPQDYFNFGYVEVSSVGSWQSIVDALLPAYQPADSFPPDFQRKLDGIAGRFAGYEDRLVETMRLVQDNIRYVSLSIGSGSYLPRRPETVLASGFGDCKDKALLLASALRSLGIEAHVTLADIDGGRGLPTWLPTLRAFDHAIVKARIGQQTYWLDATDYLQGGRADHLVSPDLGYALPLVPHGAQLEAIPRPTGSQPTRQLDEHFEFPKREGDPLVLTVATITRDLTAEALRRQFAEESVSKISDDYLSYYSRQYPGIVRVAQLTVDDDRDANVLVTHEHYELPAEALAANDLIKSFPLKADLQVGNLPTPTMIGRRGPISLGSRVNRTHSVTVSNLNAKFIGPENGNVVTPYLSLIIQSQSTPTAMTIDWSFRTLATQVPAADIGAYLKSVSDATDHSLWYYDFSYVDPGLAGRGESRAPLLVAITLLALSAVVLFILAVQEAANRSFPEGQLYWPVSIRKFLIMSALSFGLYGSFWAWRAYKQRKKVEGARIWPFWRALFFPFWLYPAFHAVNRRLSDRRLPQWIGVAAAIAFVSVWVADFIPDEYYERHFNPVFKEAAVYFVLCLAPLPLVIAVNRLNEHEPQNQIRNSRFSFRDATGVAACLAVFGAMIFLAFTSVDAG